MMETIKKYADAGCKGDNNKTPFSLYLCPVDLENNFMLIKKGKKMSCTIKLYTINSITTDDIKLCSEVTKWIDNMISKSILISEVSVKERIMFFQSSKKKIDKLINKIQSVE